MAIEISRAEAWTRAHEVFTRVNFSAFDYNTIKESLLDYVKLYFPEDFNDYIESSEFIAILEIFAYVGEIISYRLDLNAHENFISTAERKESILRLAKLISYKVSRNIAARGLVKITSIQTTEQVNDSQGRNLANTKIVWNDLNNPDWKEQFLLVLNRVLEQDFGTVSPNERVQIEDVLFELYTWNNQPLKGSGVSTFNYSATSSGTAFPMELVPVTLTSTSPVEKRPERNAKFSILYGSDGLGDGSDTTGFFCFTKQGTLQLVTQSFDGVTPNQTHDILVSNINETDVWLNNVDPSTRVIVETNPYADILPHLEDGIGRYGEWTEVDLANAQNIIFNTDKNRQKYEIETLDNDQVRLIFGDGEFSDIPSGEFDIWYRISANSNSIIQKSSVVDQTASFTYLDLTNTTQTFKFTFSLINSLQNASVSEDIEHIRRVAPSVYYTQDRMVNGRDYNSFMLQDPSILKLQAVNRTFAGDSKYIAWHDPKEYYEDVKIFGEDLALFWVEDDINNGGVAISNLALTADEVITNLVEPLLCSGDFYNILGQIPCTFDIDLERPFIETALNSAATSANPQVDLYFKSQTAVGSPTVEIPHWTVGPNTTINPSTGLPFSSSLMIRIEAQFTASNLSGWTVRWQVKRMNAQSVSTKFRNANTSSVINFNTLTSNDDNIVILRANLNGNLDAVLTENKIYNVLGQELVAQNLPNAGVPDDSRLFVIPTDTNDDGIPDQIDQLELLYSTDTFAATDDYTSVTFIKPSQYFINGTEADSVLVSVDGTVFDYDNGSATIGTWGLYPVFDIIDVNIINNPIGSPMPGSPSAPDTVLVSGDVTADFPIGSKIRIQNGATDPSYGNYNGTYSVLNDGTGAVYTGGSPGYTTIPIGQYNDPLSHDQLLPTFGGSPVLNFGSPTVYGTVSNIEPVTGTELTNLTVNGTTAGQTIQISTKQFVYFNRDSSTSEWVPVTDTAIVRSAWYLDLLNSERNRLYRREHGRYPLNFAWFYTTPRFHLVDPAASNIIDMFIITSGYYESVTRWLENKTDISPDAPTPLDLRTAYDSLLENRMISDTVILQTGLFKILFGSRAIPELQATFKVIRPEISNLTDNEVKVRIVEVIRDYFDIDDWDFGSTFFFTELSASIHAALGPEIKSIVLVPTFSTNQFGDLFQVQSRENEIFVPDISTQNIEIVQSFTPENIRQ